MKTQTLHIDTTCPEAQEAKRIGLAIHAATVLVAKDKRIMANVESLWAAQDEQHDHRCITGWRYTRNTSPEQESYWTYYPEDDVEVRIYDQE